MAKKGYKKKTAKVNKQPKDKQEQPLSNKSTVSVRRKTQTTSEQKRAAHAWKKATEAKEKLDDKYKDYVNDAKGLPALIMGSGLMQTLAFLESKDDRHRLLSEHLREWLHESHDTPLMFEAFMEQLFESSSRQFQSINREAYAWLRWLRQLASTLKEK